MRISADHDDPGHTNYDPDKSYKVFFDGVQWVNVITADEATGYMAVIATLPDGQLEIQEHFGKVTIVVTAKS
jgi:hypothetical protein